MNAHSKTNNKFSNNRILKRNFRSTSRCYNIRLHSAHLFTKLHQEELLQTKKIQRVEVQERSEYKQHSNNNFLKEILGKFHNTFTLDYWTIFSTFIFKIQNYTEESLPHKKSTQIKVNTHKNQIFITNFRPTSHHNHNNLMQIAMYK